MNIAAGCCAAENVTTQNGTTYVWPQTFGGDTATFICPLSPEFTVTRSCQFGGEWQRFDEDGCGVVSGQLAGLEDTFNNVRKSLGYYECTICCIHACDIVLTVNTGS